MHTSHLQEKEDDLELHSKSSKYLNRMTKVILLFIILFPINDSFAESIKKTEAKFVLSKIDVTSRPSRMSNQEGVLIIENITDATINVDVRFSEKKLTSSNHIIASCSSAISPRIKEEFGVLQCGNNIKQDQIIRITIEGKSLDLYTTILDGELILVKYWVKKKGIQIIDYLFDKLK